MAAAESDSRAGRILDAAADLFIHYGYDKTTVSDIARAAGISKGAVYLDFAGKEALLEALILRELERYARAWLARIEADPQGGTIGGMYKNSLHALNDNPFMSAMFRRDGRVLGTYLRKSSNLLQGLNVGPTQSPRYHFIQQMQAVGAVRDDLDPAIIAHIMNMLSYGLVAMDGVMPREHIPPADDLIAGIALLMDSALTPPGGADSAAGKAVVRQIFADHQQRYRQQSAAEREEI